ncbi:hypothetical protein IU433_12300 [Nocardia puris]|uniref:hypothetical protein n=1 Tax=Nocardia puris TaxID=208602 RepID=UPI001893A6FB|nr:hypothetical protein [Nocardia puris]MBF6459818.1 hypothetical protein [Nocardia puris]
MDHECRQGRRCTNRHRAETGWRGAGVERANTLCRGCEERAFDAVRQLYDDFCQLCTEHGTARAPAQGPKVRGGGSLPVPIPLAVDALIAAIDDETLRWTLRITKGDPVPAARGGRIAHCVRILSATLGTLVDMPAQVLPALLPHPNGGDYAGREVLDGVDAVLRLASLHQRARALLGDIETTIFLPDPCPHCGRKALAVSKDQERITCQGCRIVWDSEHFAHLSNVLDFERKAVKVA